MVFWIPHRARSCRAGCNDETCRTIEAIREAVQNAEGFRLRVRLGSQSEFGCRTLPRTLRKDI